MIGFMDARQIDRRMNELREMYNYPFTEANKRTSRDILVLYGKLRNFDVTHRDG
jgi:prophage maintenance system killer protein